MYRFIGNLAGYRQALLIALAKYSLYAYFFVDKYLQKGWRMKRNL